MDNMKISYLIQNLEFVKIFKTIIIEIWIFFSYIYVYIYIYIYIKFYLAFLWTYWDTHILHDLYANLRT